MKRLAGLSLAAIFCVGALAVPAGAAKNDGSILFTSDEGGQKDIWIMWADGTGKQKLTNDKTEDGFAVASPDGRRVAWTRGGIKNQAEIWAMNIDGSAKTQLTKNNDPDYGGLSWSPDGTKIAFHRLSAKNHDLYIMNADGTNQHNVTNHPAEEVSPDWSPDGSKIAFVSDRGGDFAIYTMATDGSNVQKLTADALFAGAPKWSADGTQILFADGFCRIICVGNEENDLWMMMADGQNQRQVTDSPWFEVPGEWSPDGKSAVVDYFGFSPDAPPFFDLATVDVRTGALTKLTDTAAINEQQPYWVH